MGCPNTIQTSGLSGFFELASCLLSRGVLPLLISIAVIAFIWGVFSYYLNPENEEKRKKGKEFILGGIIALFVIISVWGLVSVLTVTFNLKKDAPTIPKLNYTQ